jgi:hypothetical protein
VLHRVDVLMPLMSDAAPSAPAEPEPAEKKNEQVAARTEKREELWVTTQGAHDG